ncbi:MAG: asparagine synthase (glutamine-hydrolyzing) [Alphaproteobacteria bacterium]|nr:asparagine synthase (glutamine-hydrolyzing) [Alphaproteobacteria bacterium]
MCGITGLVVFKPESLADPQALVRTMVESLSHRGPDDVGVFRDGHVYFGHARLSIIDVEGGHQPIFSDQGDAIIGNGEIYNYVELKEALPPHPYHSDSDFEPALYAFLEKGMTAWRGMYAAAVWEKKTDTISVMRDPFGIKPLYYVSTPDYLAFASEPRALIKAGFSKGELSTQNVLSTMNLNYLPFDDTLYKDIKRYMPGQHQTLDQKTSTVKQSAAPLSFTQKRFDYHTPLETFDQIFEDSIKVHQRSDVPYGLFLSGGIDSTSILTMMARLNDKPIKTYTCGFDSNAVHDEREGAAAAARYFKTDHHETIFTYEDFVTLLPQIMWAFDDLTFDAAILPTYKLAAMAKKDVKVVLSGEGGDEVLAGYGRYRKFCRPRLLGGGRFSTNRCLSSVALKEKWQDPLLSYQDELLRDQTLTTLQKAQVADIKGWLAPDLLLKLDRCLMAHSLEGRTPFLDKEVFDFGFHLPQKYKIKNRKGKWLLREWLAKHCPVAEPFARKKGFSVPVAAWLEKDKATFVSLLQKNEGLLRLMDKGQIALGLEDARAAWPLLVYAVWYQVHIQGKDPSQDVFSILG